MWQERRILSHSLWLLITIILVDILFGTICTLGILQKLPWRTPAFWGCALLTLLPWNQFWFSLHQTVRGGWLLRHLDTMQRVVGTITAKEKQKLTNTDGRTVQQKEVYYPVVTYSLDGLSYEWVGTSSAYPKWNVGETVMLYFDKQTGKVWEKKDGFRMLRKGISGMVCSAVLTAMFWLVLFSKEL